MSSVLCFSYERLFYPEGKLSGQGTRIWEIGQALKRKGHKVTFAEKDHEKDYSLEDIEIIGWDPVSLKGIKKRFDAAVILLSPRIGDYFNKIEKIPTLVDLTSPLVLEFQLNPEAMEKNSLVHEGIIPTHLALEKGDALVCSSANQQMFYQGMLSLMGVKDIKNEFIRIFQFAPTKEKPELVNKGMISSKIGKNRRVILWLGNIFSWYDYETPILSMRDICKKHPECALVFVSGNNPSADILTGTNIENAKKIARKEKLLGKNIFFLDWVSYSDRLSLYSESDLVIITSFPSLESSLSYRTRIVDAFYARLPVVCTNDIFMEKMIREKKLGEVVQAGNRNEFSKTIIRLLENKKQLHRYKKNIDSFIKNEFNIDLNIAPIHEFCKNPKSYQRKSNLNLLSEINLLNERIKNLEFIKDDKEGVNKKQALDIERLESLKGELNDQVKQLRLEREDILSELTKLEDQKKVQTEKLQKECEKTKELEKIVSEQCDILKRQKEYIGQYRSSILYPFYKITHAVGKTRLGRILQKVLK